MKKALIIGFGGTFGGHVAQALMQQGWQLKVLLRDSRITKVALPGVEVCHGSTADLDAVRQAAENVDLIVYAVNPANYDWKDKALSWLNVVASVAEEKHLTLVFPGNVYVFNPENGPLFTEDAPMYPITEKGVIRVAMENRLLKASENGAQVIIVRAGDFIAIDATSTWMQQLIKPNKSGFNLSLPGPVLLTHTWAYVPDLANTVAALVNKSDTLPDFNVFHFKGHRASFADIAKCITQVTGKPVKTIQFPWWLLRMLSPFSNLFRGLVEMSYLWRKEILLSDEKLTQALGRKPVHTSLSQALIDSGLVKEKSAEQCESKLV